MSTSSSLTSSSSNSFPTREEFVAHGLSDGPIPEEAQCSICVEDCSSGEEKVVKLVPCHQCYFHETCILEWFHSSHERKGTCPNDRTVLFASRPNRPQYTVLVFTEDPPAVNPITITSARAQAESADILNDPDYITAVCVTRMGLARFEIVQEAAAGNPEVIVTQWHQDSDRGLVTQMQEFLLEMCQPRSDVSAAVMMRIREVAEDAEDNFDRICVTYANSAVTVLYRRVTALLTRIEAIPVGSARGNILDVANSAGALFELAREADWQAMRRHLCKIERLEGLVASCEIPSLTTSI
jgi:hypothetical protein